MAAPLLLILVGGLAIMMLTRDGLRSAPVHDHILFGGPASSLAHHRHTWDGPIQELAAWTSVEPPSPARSPGAGTLDGRVVSLHAAASLLLDVLSLALVIGVTLLLGRSGLGGGSRLVPLGGCRLAGQRPGPSRPPPRSA